MKWVYSLNKYNLPKLTLSEIENQSSPIAIKEIKSVSNNFPTKKSLEPDSLTGKFFQVFKEEIKLVLHKLFQKIEK